MICFHNRGKIGAENLLSLGRGRVSASEESFLLKNMTEFFEYFEKFLRIKNLSNADSNKNLVDQDVSKR